MGAVALPQSIVRQTGSRLASAAMICRSELPEHPDAINRTVSQTSAICGAVMRVPPAVARAQGATRTSEDRTERTCMQHSNRCRVVELSGLQRPRDLVSTEDDARRHCARADELE